jgi:hypothetical protein
MRRHDVSRSAEEESVDDTEHRGVRSNAQGKRQDRKDGEERLASESARGVAEVADDVGDSLMPGEPPLAALRGLTELLAHLVDGAAEAAKCFGAGLVERHPARGKELGAFLEVRRQLGVGVANGIAADGGVEQPLYTTPHE